MDTRKSVVWSEIISRWTITLGGLLVIVAVLTIMVFLFWVAVPLIGGGKQVGSVSYALPSSEKTAWLYADEFQTIGIRVGDQGEVLNFHIPSGQVISRSNVPFEGRRLTASAGTLERDRVLLGFDDGSVQFMRLRVETRTTPGADFPQAASKIDGRDFQFEDSVYTRVLTGDYRTLRPLNEVGATEKISDLPIVAVDYRVGGTVERPTIAFATVDANAQVRVSQSRAQRNMMTGAEIVRTETTELPSMNLKPGVKVTSVLLSGSADRAIVATDDGVVYRYDLRDPSKPILAESKRILPEGVAITAMTFLGGEATLVVGGSDSTVAVFFWLQIEGSQTGDGFELVQSRLHDQS
ncbi:MAG: hypothetical protein Q8R21_04475, partial [Burkholderiales bacterium]|nr:hypothetical protein [Burkholderiales bacterium]